MDHNFGASASAAQGTSALNKGRVGDFPTDFKQSAEARLSRGIVSVC